MSTRTPYITNSCLILINIDLHLLDRNYNCCCCLWLYNNPGGETCWICCVYRSVWFKEEINNAFIRADLCSLDWSCCSRLSGAMLTYTSGGLGIWFFKLLPWYYFFCIRIQIRFALVSATLIFWKKSTAAVLWYLLSTWRIWHFTFAVHVWIMHICTA